MIVSAEDLPVPSREGLRASRRTATARRIVHCAQLLADERGFDGFTMDDLAEAAGVSRRTLFNYFPSKLDALFGAKPHPRVPMEEFRAGGPTGVLRDDVHALLVQILDETAPERDQVARMRRIMRSSPRVFHATHEGLRMTVDSFLDEVRVREGDRFDETRTRLLLQTYLVVVDLALDGFVGQTPTADDGDRTLRQIYVELERTLRTVFA